MKSVKIDKEATTYSAEIRAAAKRNYINTIKLTPVNDHEKLERILRDAVLDNTVELSDYQDIQSVASFQGWGSSDRMKVTFVG